MAWAAYIESYKLIPNGATLAVVFLDGPRTERRAVSFYGPVTLQAARAAVRRERDALNAADGVSLPVGTALDLSGSDAAPPDTPLVIYQKAYSRWRIAKTQFEDGLIDQVQLDAVRAGLDAAWSDDFIGQ